MTEAILLTLWAGTFLFFVYREKRKDDDRESHERWLSDVKECLRSIEAEFRRDCKEIAKDEFARQRFDVNRYGVRIFVLRERYINELTEKVIVQKRMRITTVPEHLVREYERNIYDIADAFCYLGDLHQQKGDLCGIS